MKLTRRETLAFSAAAVSLTGVGLRAAADEIDEAVAAFTGGSAVVDGGITLTVPELAENGFSVPLEVAAPGASSVIVLANGNPNPLVASVTFGPLARSRTLSTLMRLARSQEVIAIASMEDGSFRRAVTAVEVTVGGCGSG